MGSWLPVLMAGVWLSQVPAPVPPPPPADAPPRPAEAAPAKPVLDNRGQPMRVPFECTEEDIQALGLSCTADEPCPVYLELAGIEVVGAKIFLAGNFHTPTTTLYSVLLASEDGGKTWFEPYERARAAGLDDVVFFDFATGWVSGQLLQALPRDPFFLITTDGGRNWRRRPLFSESRVGTIEEFWFDSRTSGGLLLDRMQSSESEGRYELYETMTGGESWMLRQVSSKPLRGKRAGPGGRDHLRRLRPDAAIRAFRVELRQGERWQTVASFLVEVGSCRPPEHHQAAPPPPSEEHEPAPPPSAPPPAPRKPPSLKRQP